MHKNKGHPTKAWIEKMIKDEKEGIKKYSGKIGYGKQVQQEKSHLEKLKTQLKKMKS